MYAVYCFALLSFVYVVPTLACFPNLWRDPQLAFLIPVVSATLLYGITSLCLALGIFSTLTVWGIVLLSFFVACYRIWQGGFLSKWDIKTGGVYLLHAALLLPYSVKLGTHGFERGDEIYSWHFWALQHYYGEPLDFSHTGAPYPQLFPKLLAFAYHVLGNPELQLPLRATVIVFPWAMLVAIGMCAQRQKGFLSLGYFLVLAWVLWGVHWDSFLDDAYADPVMASALIVSVALWWQARTFEDRKEAKRRAYFAVLAATGAVYAKQPALLWLMGALPYLVFPLSRIAAGLALLGGLLWLGGEGYGFYHNEGVLSASMQGRDWLTQLGYAFHRYGVERPFLLALFALSAWASHRVAGGRALFYGLLLPGILAWFLFGAYHLRLGQYWIALAFFLIVVGSPQEGFLWSRRMAFQSKKGMSLLVGISLCASIALFLRESHHTISTISWYAGSQKSLSRYFGSQTEKVFETLCSTTSKTVWVPSRYLYGLFYKRAKIIEPHYSGGHYDYATLIRELRTQKVDYVFTVHESVSNGPASRLLEDVIGQCPKLFRKIAEAEHRFQFTAYAVDKALLHQDPCLCAFFEQNAV